MHRKATDLNKFSISLKRQKLIVYLTLIVLTFFVYWQVNQHDFINFDDNRYVFDNINVQSGISPEGMKWAFTTKDIGLWNLLIWVSLMMDYQIFGLQAGGYHLTNLMLHILSTLLLFWVFNRMTGALWKSAFVAAFFALHPLSVESVAWISKRRDVLCLFWTMLTLCLYVYYTEQSTIKRYLPVVGTFVLALMSKPLVVTLPVMMILLDYWPLKRHESRDRNWFVWQLREKAPFFILSAVFSIIAIYARYYGENPYYAQYYGENPSDNYFPLSFRVANAVVSFVSYLGKILWPHDLAVKYYFSFPLPVGQVFYSAIIMMVVTVSVMMAVKRRPYLFVGWAWYSIAILPMLNVIQFGYLAMSDHHTYLPYIGIAIMLAWGIPLLFSGKARCEKTLFAAGLTAIAVLAVLTWRQCGYWENTYELLNHTCQVTNNKNNYLLYNNIASKLAQRGKIADAIDHYNKAIGMRPDMHLPYCGRGLAYHHLGQYRRAMEDYNQALSLQPDYAEAYYNRGNAYDELGKYHQAIEDYNEAIRLKPDYLQAYNNRGNTYFSMGNHERGCRDAQKACRLGYCRLLEYAKNRGHCR